MIKRLATLLMACTSLTGTAAYAQSSSDAPTPSTPPQDTQTPSEDDTIIVTARRVNENIQDVPISITAVSSETLRNQRITDVADLSRVAPSFGVTRSQRGSAAPALQIRGQRSFSASSFSEPAVTVYFAEIGQSIAGGAAGSLFDLQSVQVLKGPQGTLFGRNTTGGAVLLTPNPPTDHFEGYFQSSFGDYDFRDFEGMLNVPITNGLALRVAGKITRRDGYLYNPTTDMRAENLHSDSIRATLRVQPVSGVTSDFIGTYFVDDSVNASVLYGYDPTLVSPNLLSGATRSLLTSIYAATLQRRRNNGFYYFEEPLPNLSHTDILSLQNNTRIEIPSGLDDLVIKNIFGYRRVETRNVYSFDSTTSNILISFPTADADMWNEELQISGRANNLSFVAGLYYYQINVAEIAFSEQFGVLAPLLPTSFPSFNYSDADISNRSYAGFVHVDYHFPGALRSLTLSAGIRLTRDDREVTYYNRATSVLPTNPYRCALTGVVVPQNDRNLCAVTADPISFTKPTWDVSLSWEPTNRVNVYGAYRRGYRSGGFNSSPAFNSSNPIQAVIRGLVFRPEIVDDFELGLKSQFQVGQMRGRFNVAVFHDILTDAQRSQQTPIPGTNPPIITSAVFNAAKGNVTGAEVELELRPTERLTFSSGLAIVDTGYSSFVDNISNPTNAGGLGTLVPVDVSDSVFMLTPKFQMNATARYEIPLADQESIAFQFSFYHESSAQTAEINTTNCGPPPLVYGNCANRQGAIPGYSLVNFRGEWRNVGGTPIDAAIFVNNLFDNKYYFSGSAIYGTLGISNANPGAPRMFGIELRVHFGGE
jgi:iron complex outermembrane receptor protein